MARRQTYGERMAEFERRQDEANWRRLLIRAVEAKDTGRIQELIQEGMDEDYDFPNIPELNIN